ncbi:MAG: TetR/AcrR family transcriptional regulator [Neisseriaceae bacterium]|nr:TetR/AcrR family transcriptional regulator [Neisseriaceae bacterium]
MKALSTKKKTSKTVSTVDRIADASLMLFNQHGERNITTNHIAEHLKMSAGNLYYHFRNKEEIIFRLFSRYRDSILSFIKQNPEPSTPQELHDLIVYILDIMWEYRFLFSDVTNLLARDHELENEYTNFTINEVSPTIRAYLIHLIELKMVNMDQLDIAIFISNFWLVIKHWFYFDKSLHHNVLDKHSKLRGIKNILGMLRPYVVPEKRQDYDAILLNYMLL